MNINEKQLNTLEENNKKSRERTRFYIQEALLQLMEESDYDKIKVTDIINRASVSRSAFYRNYYWKKDILVDMCSRMVKEDDKIVVTNDIMENWKSLINHIKKHKKFYMLMEKHGLTGFLLDNMNKALNGLEENTFENVLWNGMIYNVSREWIKTGLNESPDELIDITKRQLKNLGYKLSSLEESPQSHH